MPTFKDLPVEVYVRIAPFLNSQGLLSLYDILDLAGQQTVTKVSKNGLKTLCQDWEGSLVGGDTESSNRRLYQVRPTIRRAVDCIQQFLEQANSAQGNETQRRRHLEESLTILDLFSHVRPAPKLSIPIQEFPIWCGELQVLVWIPRGAFHGMQRVLLAANVIVLSPNWDPVHYPAWASLGNANNNGNNIVQLAAESYNFVPTIPMGRIVGIQAKDQQVLKELAAHLSNQNTVAVPPPTRLSNRQRMVQAIRIVSRSQAKQRLANMPSRLPYRFYLDEMGEEDGMDLVCCWELRDLFQEATLTTAQDLIPFWKTMVDTREAAEERDGE